MGVSTLVDACGDRSTIETARAMRLRVLECRATEHGIDMKTVHSDCEITPEDIGAKPGLALVMRTSGTTGKWGESAAPSAPKYALQTNTAPMSLRESKGRFS